LRLGRRMFRVEAKSEMTWVVLVVVIKHSGSGWK
jgi:hypothetical protein